MLFQQGYGIIFVGCLGLTLVFNIISVILVYRWPDVSGATVSTKSVFANNFLPIYSLLVVSLLRHSNNTFVLLSLAAQSTDRECSGSILRPGATRAVTLYVYYDITTKLREFSRRREDCLIKDEMKGKYASVECR